MVEKYELGATCLYNGCIPTRALLHAGEIAGRIRAAELFGVRASFGSVDMAAVQRCKDDTVAGLCRGLTGPVKARHTTCIGGEGRLCPRPPPST